MRLYLSLPSPFSAKVRMCAHHAGFPLDTIIVDASTEPGDLLSVNPIGKIPVLVTDEGEAIYDSRVICEWLDRKSGNGLMPQSDAGWLVAKRTEATADGVLDALILCIYEGRFRPEEKRHEPWVEKQMRRAWRGLETIEERVDTLSPEPNIGHFALAALLGFLDLRFNGQWEAKHPKLVAWIGEFPRSFPAYEELKPRVNP